MQGKVDGGGRNLLHKNRPCKKEESIGKLETFSTSYKKGVSWKRDPFSKWLTFVSQRPAGTFWGPPRGDKYRGGTDSRKLPVEESGREKTCEDCFWVAEGAPHLRGSLLAAKGKLGTGTV